MGQPKGNFSNRSLQFTNATALTPFSIPIGWVQMIVGGNLVMKGENGAAVSYTSLPAGHVIPGPFTEFTSTTSTQIILGDGAPPPPIASGANLGSTTAGNGADAVGYPDLGSFTAQTTTGGAVNEIFASLKATKGTIPLHPTDFALLTGAPLAIFSNGASAVPGLAMVESECLAIRWNNNGTLDGVVTSYLVPPDADITADFTVHVRCAKIGATIGDAVTFAIGALNQVVGSTYIADVDYGGTTGAMTGDATTKTVQNVTRALALADLAAYPATVTLTLKPTDGTLGTDDLLVLEVFIVYTLKLVS